MMQLKPFNPETMLSLSDNFFSRGRGRRVGHALERCDTADEADVVRRMREIGNTSLQQDADRYFRDADLVRKHTWHPNQLNSSERITFMREIVPSYASPLPAGKTVYRARCIPTRTLQEGRLAVAKTGNLAERERMGFAMIHQQYRNPDGLDNVASVSTRENKIVRFMFDQMDLKDPDLAPVKFIIRCDSAHPPLGMTRDAFPLAELIELYPEQLKSAGLPGYMPGGYGQHEIIMSPFSGNRYRLDEIKQVPYGKALINEVVITASGAPSETIRKVFKLRRLQGTSSASKERTKVRHGRNGAEQRRDAVDGQIENFSNSLLRKSHVESWIQAIRNACGGLNKRFFSRS